MAKVNGLFQGEQERKERLELLDETVSWLNSFEYANDRVTVQSVLEHLGERQSDPRPKGNII